MKIFVKNRIALITLSLMTLQNCTFNEEINTDPNNPKTAPLNALLTPAEMLVAYTWGGNLSRYNGMFVQQLEGFDRQAAAIYQYQFKRSDTDDPWDNLYRALLNARDVIKLGGSTSPHYTGIAKVLTAFSLGTLTSHYGDIPYTEGVKGDIGVLQPKFDSQQSIYLNIQTLLDEAIIELASDNVGLAPGNDDIIYKGDPSLWIVAAKALKARYYLHTAKVDPTGYTNAIIFANDALTSFTGFKLTFDGASATTEAPWYQWNSQRGDIIPNSFAYDLMDTISDPRIPKYFDLTTAGGFNGGFGTYLQSPSGPVVMMARSELYFILAEAYFAQGDLGNAETNLELGVQESYSETGSSGTYNVTTVTLEEIMLQKYFSMYLSPEVWIDWRRTGLPPITPTDNVAVPRKYPYPQKEKNYNGPNVPDEGNIPYLNRMWIDPQ